MDSVTPLPDGLLADLQQEFVDMAEDSLSDMDAVLAAARETVDPNGAGIDALRRSAHDIKGLGSTLGYPLATIVAHRLEDYAADLAALTATSVADLQVFVDRLRDVMEAGPGAPEMDDAALVRRLPARPAFDPAEIVKTDVEVLLVMPLGAAARYVTDELKACGYRLTTVASPFAAFEFVARTRPDFVIISGVLDGLDGVDLACGLRAMPATRDVAIALLTAFDSDYAGLKRLPPDIPVIRKGPTFADDLAEALAKCGIT